MKESSTGTPPLLLPSTHSPQDFTKEYLKLLRYDVSKAEAEAEAEAEVEAEATPFIPSPEQAPPLPPLPVGAGKLDVLTLMGGASQATAVHGANSVVNYFLSARSFCSLVGRKKGCRCLKVSLERQGMPCCPRRLCGSSYLQPLWRQGRELEFGVS